MTQTSLNEVYLINTDTPTHMSKFPMTYNPARRTYRAYALAVSHMCDHLPYMEGTPNFDVQGTSKDLKASQTFKFKTRCSLSKGANFKTCSSCLKTETMIFARSKIEILASYMPSPLKFEFNFLPSYSYLCPVTHGMWGRMWRHFITAQNDNFNIFRSSFEDRSAILWGRV